MLLLVGIAAQRLPEDFLGFFTPGVGAEAVLPTAFPGSMQGAEAGMGLRSTIWIDIVNQQGMPQRSSYGEKIRVNIFIKD